MTARVPYVVVLPTYRRPKGLTETLDFLATQEHAPGHVLVIDCDSAPDASDSAATAAACSASSLPVTRVVAGDNLGPAGATQFGLEWYVSRLSPQDIEQTWLLRCDDDGVPMALPTDTTARLAAFAAEQRSVDRRVAGVGLSGASLVRYGTRLRKPLQVELTGPTVRVSYLATNWFPLFHLKDMRDVGGFRRDLFYGMSEVEYGLRATRNGQVLLIHAQMLRDLREQTGGQKSTSRARSLSPYTFRDYYKLRNWVRMAVEDRRVLAVAEAVLLRALLRPVANVVVEPRLAATHLYWNIRAVRDGLRGQMGRTYDPELFTSRKRLT